MRETPIKILHQGDVKLLHEFGYNVVGDGAAVCFYIDAISRAEVEASSKSENNCPTVILGFDGADQSTEIEFPEFIGWRFHSGGNGKSIGIALVNENPER